MKKCISLIVACDKKNGIGKNNTLAWNYKSDMKHFREVTNNVSDINKQNVVIMGSTTWNSIPIKFRPLKGRHNYILTRNKQKYEKDIKNLENVYVFDSIEQSIKKAIDDNNIENIFIIGGSQVYTECILKNLYNKILLTRINKNYDCDVFFPKIEDKLKLVDCNPNKFIDYDLCLEIYENQNLHEILI